MSELLNSNTKTMAEETNAINKQLQNLDQDYRKAKFAVDKVLQYLEDNQDEIVASIRSRVDKSIKDFQKMGQRVADDVQKYAKEIENTSPEEIQSAVKKGLQGLADDVDSAARQVRSAVDNAVVDMRKEGNSQMAQQYMKDAGQEFDAAFSSLGKAINAFGKSVFPEKNA